MYVEATKRYWELIESLVIAKKKYDKLSKEIDKIDNQKAGSGKVEIEVHGDLLTAIGLIHNITYEIMKEMVRLESNRTEVLRIIQNTEIIPKVV